MLGESFSGPLALPPGRPPATRTARGHPLHSFARGLWPFPARWLRTLDPTFLVQGRPGLADPAHTARAFRYALARTDGRGHPRRGPPGGAGGTGAARGWVWTSGRSCRSCPVPILYLVSHGGSPGIREEPGPHQGPSAAGRGGGLGGPHHAPPGCPGAGCPGDPAVCSVLWNTDRAA